jgi:hypothetical protein
MSEKTEKKVSEVGHDIRSPEPSPGKSAYRHVGYSDSQLTIRPAVSMGQRNTCSKSYLQLFQWLDSFASVDSRKTLPCLGLIEYSPIDKVLLKNTTGSIH